MSGQGIMVDHTQDELLWMHGLEEYFKVLNPDQSELFHTIKRAVLYGDVHAVRDLMVRELYRGDAELSDGMFVSLIMNKLLGDGEPVTSSRMLNYISHSFDDEFIKRLNEWSTNWGAKANLDDHFSRGQMKSKFWLISELNKLNIEPTQIALYGGWYATIAYFLFLNFDNVIKIRNIELDPKVVGISEAFNKDEVADNWRFKTGTANVNELQYHNGGAFNLSMPQRNAPTVRDRIDPDLIINTSCEHMKDDWFYNVPEKFVDNPRLTPIIALQTNDYFDNPQHTNCVHNIDEALEKYKFKRVLYAGTLKTELYNRFMIIGRR